MEIPDGAMELLAQAMHKEHPNLLYLADARLVAVTVAETLRALPEKADAVEE
jgi:hypothetical protein